ncbi:unnamed protein product, partial [Mesorhabditis spiculigera]
MQKRARAVETQKLRRTFKRTTRLAEQEGAWGVFTYPRLAMLWIGLMVFDALLGLRAELIWPFWIFARAIMDAVHRSGTSVAIYRDGQTQMSIIFICVTATSDLICWLFIPVRYLIFIGSTYVWLHLTWHTHNASTRSNSPFLNGPLSDCARMQGLLPLFSKVLNEFFGAHCIGYPLVIVSFSLRFYFNEWKLRRKQDDVSKKNEILYKCLVEALPAVYDGPKQYRLDNDIDYDLGPPEVPMLLPASSSHSNGNVGGVHAGSAAANNRKHSIRAPVSTTGGSSRNRRRNNKDNVQRTPPDPVNAKPESNPQSNAVNSTAPVENWEETEQRRGGILQLLFNGFAWLTSKLSAPDVEGEDASSYNDEEEDDDDSSIGENESKKNGSTNGRGPPIEPVKPRAHSSTQSKRQRGRGAQQTKMEEKKTTTPLVATVLPTSSSIQNGHAKREDSVDKRRPDSRPPRDLENPKAENHQSMHGCDLELSRVRTEMSAVKATEADLRLQLSVAENENRMSKADAAQLRSRLEQLQTRFGSLEKTREQDRAAASQLEKKYADLLYRKNEVEKELQAERRMRQEDNNKNKKSSDLSHEQREKEVRLEAETDRLRTECTAKDDALLLMQRELQQLKEYKEKTDVEGLQMEMRILKDKNSHLEDALAAENKLKLELFRALGEAKSKNSEMTKKLGELQGSSTPVANPSPPLHENSSPNSPSVNNHASHPCPPPSYDHIMASNYMPYSFSASPAPSPTGEHHLFDTGLGLQRPPSHPSSEYSMTNHFDKYAQLLAPGKTTN